MLMPSKTAPSQLLRFLLSTSCRPQIQKIAEENETFRDINKAGSFRGGGTTALHPMAMCEAVESASKLAFQLVHVASCARSMFEP